MSPVDFVEIADDGLKVWGCYSDDELFKMQAVTVGALTQ